MRKIRYFCLLVLMIVACAFGATAQTLVKIERDLVTAIEKVQKFSNYGGNYDDEKLSAANREFLALMQKHTKDARTLKYAFPKLSKHLTITTADNGKLRVYSWDTEDGGTMHNHSKIIQFQGADGKVYIKEDTENDGGSFANAVYTLPTAKTVYMIAETSIASTQDHYQRVNLFQISGKELKPAKILRTKEGLTDTVGFEYNFFSVVDREERPIRLILFDKATKTLKIPVVVETEEFPNGKVTSKFINYKFDGKNFVKSS